MFEPETFRFPEPLEIRPPEYPLDREAFDRALTTGHGRTLVHALRFGIEPFKDLILDAAIHCRYSEPVWEHYHLPPCPCSYSTDIHGWGLAKLCIMAGVADEVLNSPIDGEGRFYRWNAYQWERIEEELVAAGHMPPPPEWDEIHSGWRQRWKKRLASDGEAGMLAVAEAFGRELLDDRITWVWSTSDAVNYYDRLHGEGAAIRLLTPQAAHSRAILRFVRVHRRNQLCIMRSDKADEEEMKDYQPTPPATLDDVMDYIHGNEFDRFSIWKFTKGATQEDQMSIQRVLHESNKPRVLRRALRCLRDTGLPEFDPSLLALLAHKDEEVRDSAVQVFQHHGQPEVREAALSTLARGEMDRAFSLFHRSARNGDSRLLLEILRNRFQDKDFGDPHYVFILPLRFFRDNPGLTEPLMMLFVYEHSPCRVCRSEAFRMMMERGICPDWVLEEAPWDAMPGIREMAAGAQPWPLSGRDQFALISQIHASEPTATAEQLSARFGCENRVRIDRIEQILTVLKDQGHTCPQAPAPSSDSNLADGGF
jgi:hypothetical protein